MSRDKLTEASISMRMVQPADMAMLMALVRDFAAGDSAADVLEATEEGLEAALFEPHPRAFVEFIEWRGEPVGFVCWHYSFSSVRGRRSLMLKEIFVRGSHRGKGLGRAAMAHLARRCVAESLSGLEWIARSWDEVALSFYRSTGARVMDDWLHCTLGPEGYWRLAHEERATP